jgi:hypothetical protein
LNVGCVTVESETEFSDLLHAFMNGIVSRTTRIWIFLMFIFLLFIDEKII